MKHLKRALLLCAALALALAGGAALRQSPRTPPHSSECGRFLPLPAAQSSTAHDPPAPDLPPPPPRRDVPFRHAVHTLFLDEPIALLTVEMGFDAVVQVFPWRDFNPARGQYNWQVGDDMVRVASRYGLDLVIRLDMPPDWAVRSGDRSLPFDVAAYADFVGAVATRYRGHVLGYIIWNEPNLSAEWSRSGEINAAHWDTYEGRVADPADYVGVVGAAYARLRAADPGTLVVAGGLAPTNEISERALDDREFLRGMYAAGIAGCFDVLAVHDYGYGLSPEDERGAHDGLNLARLLDLRDIMLEHGDARPIWITELGYTVQSGPQPAVSSELQALYLRGAFERVRREWPWVEMLAVWNLSHGLPQQDEMSGYSLVEPDLTPRPAYWALRAMPK